MTDAFDMTNIISVLRTEIARVEGLDLSVGYVILFGLFKSNYLLVG